MISANTFTSFHNESGLGNSIKPIVPLFFIVSFFLLTLCFLHIFCINFQNSIDKYPKIAATRFVKRKLFSEVPLMLKHWQTHAEYQLFISNTVSHLNDSQRKKLNSYSHSIAKLSALNLDPVRDFMLPFYSSTERPALNQPQILRSFVLLMDRHCLGIDSWVDTLAHDDLLAILIDCSLDSLPPLGSYYDFINRLRVMKPALKKFDHKDTFPCGKNKKPSLKPGRDKKLPNRHPGVTKRWRNGSTLAGVSLFTMKKPFNVFFAVPPSSHPLISVCFLLKILLFQMMVPVSIHTLIHLGTKYAVVWNRAFWVAHAPDIFLTPMPPSDGTVTLALIALVTPST